LRNRPVVVAVFDRDGDPLATFPANLRYGLLLAPCQGWKEPFIQVNPIDARERPAAPWDHSCLCSVLAHGRVRFIDIKVVIAFGKRVKNQLSRMMTDHYCLLPRHGGEGRQPSA